MCIDGANSFSWIYIMAFLRRLRLINLFASMLFARGINSIINLRENDNAHWNRKNAKYLAS